MENKSSVDDAVRGKISENRTLTQRIALYIPIYRGYKEKNLRREEDKAVRELVATKLEAVKMDLATIQRSTVGNLNAMREVERLRSKVDKYYIDVKKTAAGYSGFGSSVKILEKELDVVIEWDARLMDDAEALKSKTEAIINEIDSRDANISKLSRDLEVTLDKTMEDFLARDAVLKGFEGVDA